MNLLRPNQLPLLLMLPIEHPDRAASTTQRIDWWCWRQTLLQRFLHFVSPWRRICLTLAIALSTGPIAWAQTGGAASSPATQGASTAVFPSKPIRLLVPTPPGSSVDIAARILAEVLRDRLGQPVLIENRPGAGGTIAASEVARAPADGHVLFVGFNGPLATAPLLFSKLSYDPFKSFEPIIATVAQPHVLAVKNDAPGTVREWLSQVRARPGRLNYASVGNASASHLSMELLKDEAGLFIVHIPYGGGPAATQALISGDVDALFTALSNVQAQAKAGRLKLLASADEQRSTALPDLPTLAESGLPRVIAPLWNGIVAAVGTPRDVVLKLNAEINHALALPDVRARLQSSGMEPLGGPPDRLARMMREETSKWGPIVQRTGARLD